MEDQKYRDEEDLPEKLEGFKSKELSHLTMCIKYGVEWCVFPYR